MGKGDGEDGTGERSDDVDPEVRVVTQDQDDREYGEAGGADRGCPADGDIGGSANHCGAGCGEHQQEGAERLCEQAPPLEGSILEALYPPCLARKMSAGRLLAVELAGAATLGWGAQLDQSNLPGTCASSSTR